MGTEPILTDDARKQYGANEAAAAAVILAKAQGQPFILAWWQPSDAEGRLFECDASCGCGCNPVD